MGGVGRNEMMLRERGANNNGTTYVISICMYLFLPAFKKCFRSSKLLMAKLPPETIM